MEEERAPRAGKRLFNEVIEMTGQLELKERLFQSSDQEVEKLSKLFSDLKEEVQGNCVHLSCLLRILVQTTSSLAVRARLRRLDSFMDVLLLGLRAGKPTASSLKSEMILIDRFLEFIPPKDGIFQILADHLVQGIFEKEVSQGDAVFHLRRLCAFPEGLAAVRFYREAIVNELDGLRYNDANWLRNRMLSSPDDGSM